MSLQDQLYKEAILEHYKRPRNRGELPPPALKAQGVNPSCGDELELFLSVSNGVVENIAFTGEGCAISQASASMLTGAVKGKPLAEVSELGEQFKAMLRGEAPAAALGELQALQGVAKLHARIKCAALPWTTLDQLLAEAENLQP